ncbi:hypothetical protein A2U01_0076283, partial [Trifolium medium]|nr:hypothetical protein [Trifolium medium]
YRGWRHSYEVYTMDQIV